MCFGVGQWRPSVITILLRSRGAIRSERPWTVIILHMWAYIVLGQVRVVGTRCKLAVHGAWCMVQHGAWCVVRGAWCMHGISSIMNT